MQSNVVLGKGVLLSFLKLKETKIEGLEGERGGDVASTKCSSYL